MNNFQQEDMMEGEEVLNKDSKTPYLDKFGVDVTKSAMDGNLDPVIGREEEIERIAQILSRRKKNNPVLIGEPGVGKSAIVEGLASRIVEKKVSPILYDKRIVSLDMADIVAGTTLRGQFEKRLVNIIKEAQENPDVILFIDEMHTIVGAGSASGSLDASNILKPALARGTVQCIGATTLEEFRTIEKDGALDRRFQKVIVQPSSIEDTIKILNNIKANYEKHHNVTFTNKAIEACVNLTNRYLPDRSLPDKAIDALDEAGARTHISNFKTPENISKIEACIDEINGKKMNAFKSHDFESALEFRIDEMAMLKDLETAKKEWKKSSSDVRVVVDADKVAEIVAMMSGVPVSKVTQDEGEKLLGMSKTLKGKIIGQDEAVDKIVKCIQRSRAGLKDPNRPIGTFLFMGPTGVGKTLLAKQISEQLFGSKDSLIRIDMSEYSEKHSVSNLIGAPAGYVGYEAGGKLTEKVRRHPYSVILLDEIEKAHPDLFNILLQVLDEGRLTDNTGRTVDFKNTIIIMTSNVGQRELNSFGSGVGFNRMTNTDQHNEGVITKALNKTFGPEFLNRVDDIILFHNLQKEDIRKIVDIEVDGLIARTETLGLNVKVTDSARDMLTGMSYDDAYGARAMKRQIQREIEDRLAEMIIQARLSDKDNILVDVVDDQISCNLVA